MYRKAAGVWEVLLGHLGGPFWQGRDDGAWTIPKGHLESGETPFEAALREFQEEAGIPVRGEFIPLGVVKTKSGKMIHAWGCEGDSGAVNPTCSTTFRQEWPPNTGYFHDYPEIDRFAFFNIEESRLKINAAQIPFLDRLLSHLKGTAEAGRRVFRKP